MFEYTGESGTTVEVACKQGTYFHQYFCLFHEPGNKSFPSHFASFALYQAIFLIWYLKRRFQNNFVDKFQLKGLLAVVEALILLAGLMTGTWGYHENDFYWWDILAGYIIGACMAVFSVGYLENFEIWSIYFILQCIYFASNFNMEKIDNRRLIVHASRETQGQES